MKSSLLQEVEVEQNGVINMVVLEVVIMVELRKLERQTTIPVLSVGALVKVQHKLLVVMQSDKIMLVTEGKKQVSDMVDLRQLTMILGPLVVVDGTVAVARLLLELLVVAVAMVRLQILPIVLQHLY